MKRKKIFFNVALSFLSLFLFASCGKKKDDNKDVSSTSFETSTLTETSTSTSTSTSISTSTSTQTSASTSTSTSTSTLLSTNNETTTTNTSREPYIRDDNKIYFGSYPQTLIEDEYLNTKLNAIGGEKPTQENLYNWNKDGSYKGMYYQDIDYDNDGIFDYRGVYLETYRYPNLSVPKKVFSGILHQEETGYGSKTTYWFAYDLIEWDILSESNGKAFLFSNLILDSQDFYPSNDASKKIEHNGGTGYANNYELSNIRIWLNNYFYNTAFKNMQKELIEITNVVNDDASAGYNSRSGQIFWGCNNTNDKIFLLSHNEVETYSNILLKEGIGTEYAVCRGLGVPGDVRAAFWWLRSASRHGRPNAVQGFDPRGMLIEDERMDLFGVAYYTDYGVRPACWINLA